MTKDKLPPKEREMARRLWDMTFDAESSPLQKTRAFSQAPQTVREALYFASQQPECRGNVRRNPFDTSV